MAQPPQIAIFDDATGTIQCAQQRIELRPKTYAVAKFLASHPQQVCAKETIMNAVWEHSFVEDQAVFQSINEIRRAFAPLEVIQTYPRRGYSWLLPTQCATTTSARSHPQTSAWFTPRLRMLTVLAALIIGISSIGWFALAPQDKLSLWLQTAPQSNVSAHQALMILPTDTTALTSADGGLGFGALQAVIERLPSDSDRTVFQASDVLEIMDRKQVERPQDYFSVSGATQIVSSKLSGVPGEYSLLFTVWQRDGTERHGVLHGNRVEQVINDYTEALNLQLFGELTRPHRGASSVLTTTLTHRAMTLLSQGQTESAIPFLESAVVEHPNEPMQRFLLARSYLHLGLSQQALPHIEAGLAALETVAVSSLRGRLLYLKGVALMPDNLAAASHFFTAAQAATEQQQDWLYHAYTKAMRGHVLMQQQRFVEAEPLFAESLRYQQLLNCPLGIVQGHLDYVDFYLAQGSTTKAEAELLHAEQMVRERNLESVQPIIDDYKIKLIKS